MELPPQYNPKDVEERLYQQWESAGYFHAEPDPSRQPYTIVIPPPNVTGILHMGHALNNAIQDILIRYQRMRGKNALWIPGTDHAGIATQNVVEKALAKEGKRRQDLGREAFIQRVWQWKEQYGNTIIKQLRRLGSSCDWQRTRFTMDEGLSEAVAEVFVRLYDQGLIYRGHYIINWCPRCQTALADEEAPRQQAQGKLYHIRYPLEGERREVRGERDPTPHTSHLTPAFIEVATTRPETMLGDTAIAVHPKDKRYKSLIGQHAILPIVGRKLRIIADEMVDREFGTGAVKVTPAHDPVDFQLGMKHGLEFIDVMTDDAHMTNVPEAYQGLDRFECRSKLIVDLEKAGVLGPIDEHPHNVGHCYRCNTVVEPRLSPQWFVKMKPLAEPAIKAVKDKTIKFYPSRWTKVYLNWMENIQDWCISRQIWWGHRLPVYYCNNCAGGWRLEAGGRGQTASSLEPRASSQDGIIVSNSKPAKCPRCGSGDLKQDEDVLDTWFSSWLWPFSTLGWPKETPELGHFYPTNALVTAQEIIFFWVARMIMAGYFCMGKPPFTAVYIHGTVRDITGKKMSKSLGNIIDPLEIIEKYGTDALRYTLITSTAIGQDVFLSEERFTAGRNFANKLWNATRFVLSQLGGERSEVGGDPHLSPLTSHLSIPDRWILSRLQRTIERVTTSLDHFLFNDAATALYDFLWHDFCDWYLEVAKVQLSQRSEVRGQRSENTDEKTEEVLPTSDLRSPTSEILAHVLETSFRLLHPVMPFVTEELWQHLRSGERSEVRGERVGLTPHTSHLTPSSIMIAEWPKVSKKLIDEEAEALFEQFKAVVGAIRNTRAELNVPLGSRPSVHLVSSHPVTRSFFEAHRPLIQTLAQTGEVHIDEKRQPLEQAAATVVDGIEVLMPLAGLIDIAQERKRLQQRVDELAKHLTQTEARLNDPQFTGKAPAEVIEQAKERRTQLQESIKKFSTYLALLQSM